MVANLCQDINQVSSFFTSPRHQRNYVNDWDYFSNVEFSPFYYHYKKSVQNITLRIHFNIYTTVLSFIRSAFVKCTERGEEGSEKDSLEH